MGVRATQDRGGTRTNSVSSRKSLVVFGLLLAKAASQVPSPRALNTLVRRGCIPFSPGCRERARNIPKAILLLEGWRYFHLSFFPVLRYGNRRKQEEQEGCKKRQTHDKWLLYIKLCWDSNLKDDDWGSYHLNNKNAVLNRRHW